MAISELLRQRKLTRAVAAVLTAEIESHLQTITPLINPRRVFAEHIHGGPRAVSKTGSKALKHLQERYAEIHGSAPFDLRRSFDTPLMLLDTRPELQALSYRHAAHADGIDKTVTVSRPLQWILSYRGFGPARLRELLDGSSTQTGPTLQETVLHYLMLAVILEMQPELMKLMTALRFPVSIETLDEFGRLPVAVISGPLSTQRPDDQVIIDSTEVSGSNDFEEILDSDALQQPLNDPLRDRLLAIAAD